MDFISKLSSVLRRPNLFIKPAMSLVFARTLPQLLYSQFSLHALSFQNLCCDGTNAGLFRKHTLHRWLGSRRFRDHVIQVYATNYAAVFIIARLVPEPNRLCPGWTNNMFNTPCYPKFCCHPATIPVEKGTISQCAQPRARGR